LIAQADNVESSSEKIDVLMKEISNLKEECEKKDSTISDLKQQLTKTKYISSFFSSSLNLCLLFLNFLI
jgi:hypothetical protein